MSQNALEMATPKQNLTNKKKSGVTPIQILSPFVDNQNNQTFVCIGIECNEIAEKHFCSVPCQRKWYDTWCTKTPYRKVKPLETGARIVNYEYLGTGSGNSSSSGSSSSSSSNAIHETASEIYRVPLCEFNASYKLTQVNTSAWRAFGLPWQEYVKKICMPVASVKDKNLIADMKTPPTKIRDFKVLSPSIYKRLHFLLYNIVYNVTALRITFPANIQLCKVSNMGRYVIADPNKRHRFKGAVVTKTQKEAAKLKIREQVKVEQAEADNEQKIIEKRKRLEKRKRRNVQVQEEIDRSKYVKNLIQRYEELKNERRLHFRNKKAYVRRYSAHWPDTHENLNAVGGGMPGSVNNAGSFELLWLIGEVMIANGIAQDNINLIEEGVRTLDQARNNKIYFPHAAHFGYEYENFLNFSMYDQEETDLSLMELDELNSVYDKDKLNTQPYQFAYNVGYGEESATYTYPKFLTTKCSSKECNRFSGLGDRNNPNSHRCATCGFNQFGSLFSGTGSINVCTWFSKSWDPKEKQLKLRRMGESSSKIEIFFMGDELKEHKPHHDESVLNFLNNGNSAQDEMKWVCYEKGFVCQLVGGGTTFHGAIYIRKKLLKANNWINDKKREKYEVMEQVLKYYEELKSRPQAAYVNEPEFNDSTLLRLFQRCRTSTVQFVTRAVKNIMVMEGDWKDADGRDNIGYPDPGSMAIWVDKQAEEKRKEPIDIIKDCLDKHFKSFRESFRGLRTRGVQTNSWLDTVSKDMEILMSFTDERHVIYNGEVFTCDQCNLEGTKAVLFGHLHDNRNCCVTDVWFKSVSTMEKVIEDFQERIRTLDAQIKEMTETATRRKIQWENEEIDESQLSDEDYTHIIVKKVIDIFEKTFSNLSEEEQNREYLYRKKANITNAQIREYLRWNRVCKNYRSYTNYSEFYIAGKQYRVNHYNHNKRDDTSTRARLIAGMYDLDFPEMQSIQFLKNVDCVVVDSAEKAFKTRLRVILKNKIRRKRFRNLNGTLVIGINYDGAPFNKTGELKSQTVLLGIILNEGFKATMESLILLGVLSADEGSEEARMMVSNIDEKLAAFAADVLANGIEIDGQRFTKVEYVLSSDLKAANKVTGTGPHSSEYFGLTHVGLSLDACGYGVTGRATSEEALFEDFQNASSSSSTSVSWKKGDKPIPVTASEREQLFKENKTRMRSRASLLNGDSKMKARYQKAALDFARKKGHSFVYEPFFKKTHFITATFCALHYKSVKVLDFLDLSCQAFMNYDRLHGITDDVGSSLDSFLEALENDPLFKCQLSTYATDARTFWEKAKVAKGLCHSGDGLAALNRLLAKDKVKASRLLGRQANYPLRHLEKFRTLFSKARKKAQEHHKESVAKEIRGKKKVKGRMINKTKEDVEKDFDYVVASLLSLLLAIRNMVYYMGMSGLDIFEKNVDVSPSDLNDHIHDLANKVSNAALEIELLQTNLFPLYHRAYDVCVTFCIPHVTSILVEIGILHGQAGLLECFESFHKYFANINAYQSAIASDVRESRNQYKFTTIWLIFSYLPLQPYSVASKARKRKAGKRTDIIPPRSNYGSDKSCYCGACTTVRACSFCNAGGNNCTVGDLYDLVSKTKKYIKPDVYLTAEEKRKPEFSNAFDIANGKRYLFIDWQDNRVHQYIKGLRCKPVS